MGVRDQTTQAITCCLPGRHQQEAGVRSHSQESSLLSSMGRGIKCPPALVFPDKDLTSRPHLGASEPCEHILNPRQPCAELNLFLWKKSQHLEQLVVQHQNRNNLSVSEAERSDHSPSVLVQEVLPHWILTDLVSCMDKGRRSLSSPLILVMNKNIWNKTITFPSVSHQLTTPNFLTQSSPPPI